MLGRLSLRGGIGRGDVQMFPRQTNRTEILGGVGVSASAMLVVGCWTR